MELRLGPIFSIMELNDAMNEHFRPGHWPKLVTLPDACWEQLQPYSGGWMGERWPGRHFLWWGIPVIPVSTYFDHEKEFYARI